MSADHTGSADVPRAAHAALPAASQSTKEPESDHGLESKGEAVAAVHGSVRQATAIQGARLSAKDLIDQAVELTAASALTQDAIADVVRDGVIATLRRRNVAEENLRQPSPNIVALAVAAMPYTSMRNEFCSLIASAMEASRARFVLPAYVDQLRYLSRDEVELMRALPPRGRFTPIADLVLHAKSGHVQFCVRHILGAEIARVFTVRENIAQSIDNLIRLGLVSRPPGHEANEETYLAMSKRAFLRDVTNRAPKDTQFVFDRGVLGVTDLGDMFKSACLD